MWPTITFFFWVILVKNIVQQLRNSIQDYQQLFNCTFGLKVIDPA